MFEASRPSSFVPAHTLAHLLGLSDPDRDSVARNWVMHYGTGALGGVLRAAVSAANLPGPGASIMHYESLAKRLAERLDAMR